jgi:hypothetical protein
MKLIRSISMATDHNFYGFPVEVTRVDLFIDSDVMTPEIVAIAKRLQIERLHQHAKAMPHKYWQQPNKRPYADELGASK